MGNESDKTIQSLLTERGALKLQLEIEQNRNKTLHEKEEELTRENMNLGMRVLEFENLIKPVFEKDDITLIEVIDKLKSNTPDFNEEVTDESDLQRKYDELSSQYRILEMQYNIIKQELVKADKRSESCYSKLTNILKTSMPVDDLLAEIDSLSDENKSKIIKEYLKVVDYYYNAENDIMKNMKNFVSGIYKLVESKRDRKDLSGFELMNKIIINKEESCSINTETLERNIRKVSTEENNFSEFMDIGESIVSKIKRENNTTDN